MSIFHSASHVAVSGGNFVATGAGSLVTINQGGQPGGSSAFKDLSAAAAHTALHDSAARFNAPRCHRNTRAKYRDQLELWMLGKGEDFEGKQLIWLHGGAGAGKSAIMQSVVEQCAQHGSVLGSFFFSRADSSRNTAEALIPTLAYQVAHAFPEAMGVLDPFIQRNPLIFKASLQTQTVELLVRPLLHLFKNRIIDNTDSPRRVFVIDGLDECDDPQIRALIIHLIASILCDHHLPICFLVASRLEIAISSAFEREKRLRSRLATISLDNDADAESDIRQFIEDSFLDILDSHPWRMNIMLPWPDSISVDNLVVNSSGHFIYAVTAMKYIASSDEHPGRALQVVRGLVPSRTGSPFEELDALYMHIITSARYSKQILEIIRHCYLSHLSNSVINICRVQDIAPHDLLLFLSDIQPLISFALDNTGEPHVIPKHASLGDFITNEARSQELYIGYANYHASRLARYFHLLNAGPDGVLPSFDSIDQFNSGSVVPVLTDDVSGFVYDMADALMFSEDTDSLRFLVASHSPHNIWSFYVESLALGATISESVTNLTRRYMRAVRDSVGLDDDTQYIYQLQMYIELVLDDINDFVHKVPQFRIIPALMFSSDGSGLLLANKLMFWDNQFHIHDIRPTYIFEPLQWCEGTRVVDPRACEAIRQMPQSRLSWSPDLAIAMTLFIEQLVHLSGPSPSILHSSPHRQWLRRHKGLKHISHGLPRMSSAVCHHIYAHDVYRYEKRSISFLYSRWRRLQPPYWDKIRTQRGKCRALLEAVILYLHKADLTNEVAVLARRSLPIVALWFPKLMKRACAEMDAYVQRWEESPECLLEMTKSLHVNDMD